MGGRASTALKLLLDEIYFDLKHFRLNIISSKPIDLFCNQSFFPFIGCFGLEKISFSYGDGFKWYYNTNRTSWDAFEVSSSSQADDNYFDAMVHILSNLPPSLKSLQLEIPHDSNQNETHKAESMKLVQKLCESQANQDNNLETI